MTLVNVGSIKWSQLLFLVWLVISDLYFFHLIVLLNPVLTCSKIRLPFAVDKVTTGMYIGIKTYRSYALSINTLLIFDMQLVNGTLFLNAKGLLLISINSLSASFVRVIVPLTTYMLHQ